MQKHLVLTIFGLAAGFLLLAWVEPMTNGGATLLVVLSMLLFNALGTTLSAVARLGAPKVPDAAITKPAVGEPKRAKRGPGKAKKLAALLIPLAALSAARPREARREHVIPPRL